MHVNSNLLHLPTCPTSSTRTLTTPSWGVNPWKAMFLAARLVVMYTSFSVFVSKAMYWRKKENTRMDAGLQYCRDRGTCISTCTVAEHMQTTGNPVSEV